MAEPVRDQTSIGHAAPGGDAGDEEVDEFLRESRFSLTGEYWRPSDSFAPGRLFDMSDEPVVVAAPPPARSRIRPLDIAIGVVGLVALILLVFALAS